MAPVRPTAGYQYDINGRLSEMTMNNGSGPQALASATYNADGQLHTLWWAPGTETRGYNGLGQLTGQSLPWYLNMTYSYSTTQNNGRITSSVDGMTGESTTYTYDALNRLTVASNSLWSQSYTYDGFGNLLTKSLANGSPNPSPSLNVTYNANNQQNGLSYDANGNQVSLPSCGGGCYNAYSVENRLVRQVEGGWPDPSNLYAYDPWGKRVMSGSDPAPGVQGETQPNYTYTFYGITGQRLATLNCNGSNYPAYPNCTITGQNVYYGKKLIVSGGVAVVTDRLGTVRADTQGEAFAYYPYGEERSSTPDGRNKFATYFRDTIGQDYADQRYYNAGIGRFWNVDPGGMATGNPADPGSWNRYAYAEGDPINSTDRHGLFMCVGCGDDSGDDGDDGGDGGYGGGGGYSPVPGGGSGGGGGGSALPKCADLLSNTITSFLKSANSPLLTQDPSFVSQVMAEAQLVGVSPLLFAAETMESGYGTSVVATTMDNPFGLKSNNQNINYSGQGGVASAIVAEGNTLNNLVNNLGENLGQMYSGLPGLTDARGWNWLRPPAYCQSAGCPSFGTDLGKALVKMGGDPNNLKYPKGQVGKTKCQ